MSSSTSLEDYLVNYATICIFCTHWACVSPTFPRTIEATQALESIGFLVHALVSDGALPNRKPYKKMVQRDEHMFYILNPFDRSRCIYFVSDVSHLRKTTRNCFENSCWNIQTRNLHVSLEFLLQFSSETSD